MRVCHIINSLNRGGAETHLLELVRAQKNAGIHVNVLSLVAIIQIYFQLKERYQIVVIKFTD